MGKERTPGCNLLTEEREAVQSRYYPEAGASEANLYHIPT